MRKKKPAQFAKRKRAFDNVMATYRASQKTIGGLGATVFTFSGHGLTPPAKPSLADFRVDVEKVVEGIIPKSFLTRFRLAYYLFDSESPLDCEVYAEKVFGSIRHGYEQKIGAEFLKRGLTKGYFLYIRGSHEKS